MPLDPLIAPLLKVVNERPRPEWTGDAAERRRQFAQRPDNPYASFAEVEPETDIQVEGNVRIYPTPGARGALVFFHGGGWWLGSAADSDMRCRAFAARAGVTVFSVDYRLAPEHPFPTALEDCYQALTWAVDQADRFGFDPELVAVAGESAGGNLAAAVALLARERGGPSLKLQLLEIPALDLTLSSPSIERYAKGYVLSAEDLRWCVEQYMKGHDPADPLVSPLLAEDLTGLPPAYIAVAEFDPLVDDGHRYAERLKEAGVPVTLRVFEGQVHGSQSLTALLPAAREWRDSVVGAVREHLSPA
ncbi:alpha/beta hydrolase [Nonomuraea sp. NPDC050556]|uniref:alpha/beta hydrolase n=1 Tax=Nonomuraea sp. NPDC050556 TaxID=3364369 RepID=UPI0037AE90B9